MNQMTNFIGSLNNLNQDQQNNFINQQMNNISNFISIIFLSFFLGEENINNDDKLKNLISKFNTNNQKLTSSFEVNSAINPLNLQNLSPEQMMQFVMSQKMQNNNNNNNNQQNKGKKLI